MATNVLSGERIAVRAFTKQAVVLVGGKGARLGGLTSNVPKPLLPIDSEAVFLDEVIFNIARHGFDNIVLLAGYMGEQVLARYSGKTAWGADIRVFVETEVAGTAGALANAKSLLDKTFLLVNGDTLFDVNLRRLEQILVSAPEAIAALALRRVPHAGRFGSVDLEAGRIVAFHEKKAVEASAQGLVNGGVGLFRREVLALIDEIPCSLETDVYPRLAAAGRLAGEEFSSYFIDIGLPDTLAQARDEIPRRRRRPAIFFDRDGVLNRDKGYTHQIEDMEWIPGAIEMIRRANDMGALAIVVTNQAGVAHGYYSLADAERFHAAMAADLASAGAHIDAFYTCPYHPLAAVAEYRHPDHPDRKPNPGMILKASSDWPVDLARSVLVGDRESDLEAARRAGVRGFLVTGGELGAVAEAALGPLAEAMAGPDEFARRATRIS